MVCAWSMAAEFEYIQKLLSVQCIYKELTCVVCMKNTKATSCPLLNHLYITVPCMNPETIPGSAANTNNALFYYVEADCNGLPCGPYIAEKELTCVVCTI